MKVSYHFLIRADYNSIAYSIHLSNRGANMSMSR